MKNPLTAMEELCSNPTIYLTQHFREEDGDLIYVATLSDHPPHLEEERKATWSKSDIAVDIYHGLNLGTMTSDSIAPIGGWLKTICCLLTFRGQEVVFDGVLFRPSEADL